MALDSFVGERGNLLEETPKPKRSSFTCRVSSSRRRTGLLCALEQEPLQAVTISTLFATHDETDLPTALDALLGRRRAGSGRQDDPGPVRPWRRCRSTRPVPMLLAIGAVHHALIRAGLRNGRHRDRERRSLRCAPSRLPDRLRRLGDPSVRGAAQAASLAGTRGYEELTPTSCAQLPHGAGKGLPQDLVQDGHLDGDGLPGRADLRDDRAGPEIWSSTSPALPPASVESATPNSRGHPAPPRRGLRRSCGRSCSTWASSATARMARRTPTSRDGQAAPGSIRHRQPVDFQAYRDHVATHPPTAVRDLLQIEPLGAAVPLDEVEPVERSSSASWSPRCRSAR